MKTRVTIYCVCSLLYVIALTWACYAIGAAMFPQWGWFKEFLIGDLVLMVPVIILGLIPSVRAKCIAFQLRMMAWAFDSKSVNKIK